MKRNTSFKSLFVDLNILRNTSNRFQFDRLLDRLGAVLTLLLITLAVVSSAATVYGAQTVNWANMHGVAYRSGANALYCVQGSTSCDSPTVAPPSTAFSVYKQKGFNFARISLDWNYMMNNPSGATAILQQDANACDASGISCYYMWGGSYQYIPPSLENLFGCASNDVCFHNNFGNNAVIPAGSGTPYDGQTLWQAVFNGLFKPAIQTLDSHSSTVGYAPFNEPNTGWSNTQLTNYYLYEAQQFRTLTAKAFIFQAFAGGAGGGGRATIQQLCPASYKPCVFEIHNYQGVVNYNPYPSVVSQCAAAGCAGVFLGEWGASSNPPAGYSSETQFMTAELNAVKLNGMGNEWFDYSGTNPTTGALTATLQLLSQLDGQILGSGQTSTSTTGSSSTTSTSSTTSKSTTSTSVSTQPSCSPSNVCLSWGYAPTTVAPEASAQWQGLVTVPSGTNPAGIPVSWYLDDGLVYSTATAQGGGPTEGVSYFNYRLTAGTHTLYFAVTGAQSPRLNIVAGSTTATSTTSTTTGTHSTSSSSSTTTSTSYSTTTSFLSSSSQLSSSFTTTATQISVSTTTSSTSRSLSSTSSTSTTSSTIPPSTSTSSTSTHQATTIRTPTTMTTTSNAPTSANTQSNGASTSSSPSKVNPGQGPPTTTNTQEAATTPGVSSTSSPSSYLFPTMTSVVVLSGTLGLVVIGMGVVLRLRFNRSR